ncbi:MAG TPA: glycoside hydrolase family 9 protein [Terriglobales bacterium]|nr:glycoside hydrolase family 9 protein [Terriglobales bacterium]
MKRRGNFSCLCLAAGLFTCAAFAVSNPDLHLTQQDVLETHGLSVLLFHNSYHRVFGDQKMSGLEIILHDQRIATNGDVRLSPTPEQWDPIPDFKERKRGTARDEVFARCEYPKEDLAYRIDVRPEPGGFRVAVQLDKAIPASLAGKAGLNLEFLPSFYFGKSYLAGEMTGVFPRHPDGPMKKSSSGVTEPLPLATASNFILSPEDPVTRVTIASDSGPIMMFDGRDKAQNGWFVLRTLLPVGKTGDVVVWHVRPNVIPGWVRQPVIGYNQVGYTPAREKVSVVELDPLFTAPKKARVLKMTPDGQYREVFSADIKPWGKWTRYQYARFDFTAVREPGIYVIEYAGQRTGPFRIADNIYDGIWRPTLETYLPEQMDHVAVREGYRIWHGASHLDDARQAPVDYVHFDGYKQGPATDSSYKPGEHIPGINVGGWFDAGDFDLRTQTHTRVIRDLVQALEQFRMTSDDTLVDEKARYVEMRKPDGIPDVVQQIEHGAMLLLAEDKAFGHAIPGIIAPTLQQYTHLGDAASKTDGKVYSEQMGPLQSDGIHSGVPDDRWAFTMHTTALNYGVVSALAAASRGLRGFNDAMADNCLQTAQRLWSEEQQHPAVVVEYFNTTGEDLKLAETEAAIELVITTHGAEPYTKKLAELMPVVREQFLFLGGSAARAIPFMGEDFKAEVETALSEYLPKMQAMIDQNPYGVPISMGTWGGAGWVTRFASEMYLLHEAFPKIVGPEYTLHALDYVLGNHPVSNVSLVSTVGANSKLIAYGNNRADYTFVPGGMVPGVVILKPDFPELTNDWPFFWYENEYVVDAGSSFILAAGSANAETRTATER